MKAATVLLSLIIFIFTTTFAQRELPIEQVVGFACFEGGTSTPPVKKTQASLEENDWEEIAKQLSSSNPAEQFLAALALEYLIENGRHIPSSQEKGLIKSLRQSPQKLGFCSGCFLREEMSLKELFDGEAYQEGRYWVKRVLGEK